jgi:TPR repeat protein
MPLLRRLLNVFILLLVLCASLFAEVPNFEEVKKRAEAGNAVAQFNLGVMYAGGMGVPKDDVEAVKWYRKAADQGVASAQCNLGFMYHQGKGVPKDAVEAVKWYREAADQGDVRAQSNLGFMYAEGRGVLKDEVEGYAWYNIAALSNELAKMVRDNLNLTPEEKARAQKRSTELFNEIEARKKAGK